MRTGHWLFLLLLMTPACARADSAAESVPAGVPAAELWDAVLEDYHRDGGLDYAGLQADREGLDRFLAKIQAAQVESLSREGRMAFWINAYNAVVAHFVLEGYPELTSVKNVDGFFDGKRYPVAGQPMTLDEVESAARDLGDPRVHFAVVCASTSCPDLRHEAFVEERLDQQLAEQTTRFLADPEKGARYDAEDNILHLSSIFKWYAGDFTGGSTVVAFFARGQVADWVAQHAPEPLQSNIGDHEPTVRYLDYDWSLNDRPSS